MDDKKPSAAVTTVIDSIHHCPLNVFIDCIVDGELRGLVIEGEVQDEELNLLWRQLLDEFLDAMSGNKEQWKKRLFKNICAGRIKLFLIDECVKILSRYWVPQIVRKLNLLLRTNFKFDINDPASYDNELKRALKRSNGIKLECALMEEQLIVLSKNVEKNNVRVTRKFFADMLITLSNHAGYELDEEKMTAYKFAERVRRLNKHAESNNSRDRKTLK